MKETAIGKGPSARGRAAGAWMMLALSCGLVAPALADTGTFAPDGQDFSVQFPANPKSRTSNNGDEVLSLWKGTDDGFYYVATRTSNKSEYAAEIELSMDVKNFVDQTKATIVEQHRMTWPTPAGPAEALRYSFRMPQGQLGEGLYVVAGNREFSVAVKDDQPGSDAGRRERMNRFIESLKILR